MSALGQKQTFALHRPCPLYPQERTFAVHKRMSAWANSGHQRLPAAIRRRRLNSGQARIVSAFIRTGLGDGPSCARTASHNRAVYSLPCPSIRPFNGWPDNCSGHSKTPDFSAT